MNLSHNIKVSELHSANINLRPLSSYINLGKKKTSSNNDRTNLKTFCIVGVLHLAILGWFIFKAESTTEQPVLSFTVTMMDISSSPNVVANAASSPSNSAKKQEEAEKKTEASEISISKLGTTQDKQKEKTSDSKKTTEKENKETAPKSSAPVSVSSQKQTAVLAPSTPASFDAAYLNNPAPNYPPLSRRLGEHGKVLVNVFVNNNGLPEKIELKKSSGFSRLDIAAEETVKKWRFISAKQGSQLVASWVIVPIDFILE